MKIGILGDPHFGARNDLKLLHNHFRNFYNYFFQYLHENGIDTVIHVGDLFDRRKYINFQTLYECKEYFFKQLENYNIKLITIIGNHDIFYRESLEINSPELLLAEYSNIQIIREPTTIQFEDTTIDFIPWICRENKDDAITFINNSKSDICCGHFELAGFAMYKGVESSHGDNSDIFSKYEAVWSGHYHTRSQKDNITYVGTPYEITWHDYNDVKGFHVFDTDTRILQFHENPFKYFIRIEYSDDTNIEDLNVKDCFVKVVVINKNDVIRFDQFIQNLNIAGVYDLKIIEDITVDINEEATEETVNLEDTMSVVTNYIDSIIEDNQNIKDFMKSLYIEAINLGVV